MGVCDYSDDYLLGDPTSKARALTAAWLDRQAPLEQWHRRRFGRLQLLGQQREADGALVQRVPEKVSERSAQPPQTRAGALQPVRRAVMR